MRPATSRILIALFGLLAITGCAQPPTQQLTGTLRGTPSIDGGAPTTWVLTMGGEGSGYSMPLDVSAVRAQADALNGKTVTITAQNNMGGSQQTWIVKKINAAGQ